MKSKKDINNTILLTTLKIQEEYPELTKYLDEIPEHALFQANGDISNKGLVDYLESLKDLLKTYAKVHDANLPHQNSMKQKDMSTQDSKKETEDILKIKFPGYPTYPESEDIYNQDKEETDMDPEDLSKIKSPNETSGTKNEKGFEDDVSGSDLDVPGSELDDQQERIGSEDEENNYYSLGGDENRKLDEDNG